MTQQQRPNPVEVYEEYFGPAIAIPWAHLLLDHAAPQPGERVLDVACGTGIVARHVAPIVGAAGKVVALDISTAMLVVAAGLPAPAGAPVEWRTGSALSHSLPSDLFDLVLCQQGLQFFSDRAAALREMRRVMTENGRVVVSVWQALGHHPVYEALLEATARHLGVNVSAISAAFSLWDGEELRTLLGEAGFNRVEIIPASHTSYFPSPERFVQITLLTAAAVMPEFERLSAVAHSELSEAIAREIEDVMQGYRDGDRLIFPMSAHIAIASS
jgi:ubiquinone/menaquinone biosynthesis C-methylase UbiE